MENAGDSRHFSLAGGFVPPGRALPDGHIVLLLLLASTLLVVSCATVLERAQAPSIAAEEPAPAVTTPAPPEPRRNVPDPLAERGLIVPVRGIQPWQIEDNFESRRGRRMHNALDIMARRGTPVIAADDGRVVRAYRHSLGGLCIYQLDPGGRFAYYYAHMDAFAAGVREGMTVAKGDVLGYVGTTGNATPTAPHLHFAISRLDADGRWWRGEPVNPYPYLVSSPARASP